MLSIHAKGNDGWNDKLKDGRVGDLYMFMANEWIVGWMDGRRDGCMEG